MYGPQAGLAGADEGFGFRLALLYLNGDWSKFPIIRVLYLGSHYNTGPYIHFPHFGNSNLGKLSNGVSLLFATQHFQGMCRGSLEV